LGKGPLAAATAAKSPTASVPSPGVVLTEATAVGFAAAVFTAPASGCAPRLPPCCSPSFAAVAATRTPIVAALLRLAHLGLTPAKQGIGGLAEEFGPADAGAT